MSYGDVLKILAPIVGAENVRVELTLRWTSLKPSPPSVTMRSSRDLKLGLKPWL